MIIFIQPTSAFTEMSVPFITTDLTVFVAPLEIADLSITEFNQTNYAEVHIGNLDISGPGPADTTAFDNTVLNIGDTRDFVSPVLPSMKQNRADIFRYDRTYLFIDTLG
ncbi:MAG TPA: hypothetical protein VGK13_00970 [Methanocellaceae archaeon]